MKLVIVESPAKAKTINKYLDNGFKVIASFGHIRDLPSKNGSVLPDEDFAMKYIISDKAEKYVEAITKDAAKAEMIYLATDRDREGESIAWHVAEIIKEKNLVKSSDFFKRVAFDEVTKKAILHAIENPRKIDIDLVNAQQARRALDYLVGFTLSPILWRKLPGCRSAGRVQSVALRLICEREDEIERFKSQEYWDISLNVLNSNNEPFLARLTHVNGKKLEKFSITNELAANDLVEKIKLKNFHVASIEKKQQKRQPQPPFITSSLQQEAARKLGFTAKKTMQIAQKLYEGMDIGNETIGLITYMRTDGTTLASEAVEQIRQLIDKNFGDKYLPTSQRVYKSKAKNAQEAHEAIRPTDITLLPEKLKDKLDKDYYKLYDLIWKRTVACQMENVIIDLVVAQLDTVNSGEFDARNDGAKPIDNRRATSDDVTKFSSIDCTEDKEFTCRANGSIIAFDGFYKIYREGLDDETEEENRLLPPLKEGEKLITDSVNPAQHFTDPPPRYSEASLVKRLEELGIGRPSTYASIISVLQDRKYVVVEKKRFFPEELGRLVTTFLTGFFKKYVEYDFTADLENDLDEVAEGKIEWKSLLKKFWDGFNNNVEVVSGKKISDIITYVEEALDYHLFGEKSESNNSRICPSCSTGQLGLKLGKFGAFLACSNYPECTFKKQITSKNSDDVATMEENKLLGVNKDGFDVFLKKGPYGLYVQTSEQVAKGEKPKRASLPPSIAQSDVTLDLAMRLLELPVKLCLHPESQQEIILGIGRYGPYLKYLDRFISIPKRYDPFTITTEIAVEIIEASNNKLKNKQEKDNGKQVIVAKKTSKKKATAKKTTRKKKVQ
ncbi:type I DNA topoisomerase [Candidatus Tisiphia endosymbiont of Nedyus quadrimaculatus]|uniref:type I DNA topoisomerase n=1 Tax=Candidatus Tisiphia endosymbiont of Nedyus quadrimaculatus TaxID=3139332 RepID=UPI00345EB6AF